MRAPTAHICVSVSVSALALHRCGSGTGGEHARARWWGRVWESENVNSVQLGLRVGVSEQALQADQADQHK
jgi:hypothetical protein